MNFRKRLSWSLIVLSVLPIVLMGVWGMFIVGNDIVDSELYGSANTYAIFMGVVIVLTLITVFIISRRLSGSLMSPINKLQDVFSIAEKEKIYLRADVEGCPQEFHELANGYNSMITQLERANEERDKAIKDLSEKEEALVQQNSALEAERDHSEFLITYDHMTGMYSRYHFERIVSNVLKDGSTGGILFLNLDSFKQVNNSFSHEFGDRCLTELGIALSAPTCEHDMIARVGGDEFLMLCCRPKEEVEKTAKIIHDILQTPFMIDDTSVLLTGSIGVAMFPQDGTDLQALLKNADLAMYEAKKQGKNQYCFYDSTMSDALEKQMEILDVLRTAKISGDVFLAFQPQVNPVTGRTVAFEALARMRTEKLGSVSPAEFIPLAESTGLIVPFGQWVLENACLFGKSLLKAGMEFDYVSINVSQMQLKQENYVQQLMDTLDKYEYPPQKLKIEIIENIMTNADPDTQKLQSILENKVGIALDDFGTGYSSLNYLLNLPIDTVKIDRSFVDDICTNEQTRMVCSTIIKLVHKLGYKAVAEGIETESQVNLLTELGCDVIQGYYYSHPLEAEMALEYIAGNPNETI